MIYDFKDEQYERESKILFCNCLHPLCNGKYIQVFLLQKSCYHSFMEYVDKSTGELDIAWYNQFIINSNQTMDYTKEQIEDITIREKEALETLRRLQLTPSCQITWVQDEGDTFKTRLIPYLQDLKYKK